MRAHTTAKSLTSLTGYAFAKKLPKNNEKKNVSGATLPFCGKKVLSSETWKFAERDDFWRHPYFPAKFARVAKCKVERSLMWTVETRAAMTWFSLLLGRQLKRAIRQGMSSKTLSMVRVWRKMASLTGIHWWSQGDGVGSRENAPLAQRWPTVKGTDKISRLKYFFLHMRLNWGNLTEPTGRPDLLSLLWPISY